MSFETALKSHLQSDATVSSLVDDRIHPNVLPERSALSAITYTHIAGSPVTCLDGFTSGVTRHLMQIDCWAATYNRVIELALAVRDRMAAWPATFKTAIVDFPAFDDFEPVTGRYRRSITVACWFTE